MSGLEQARQALREQAQAQHALVRLLGDAADAFETFAQDVREVQAMIEARYAPKPVCSTCDGTGVAPFLPLGFKADDVPCKKCGGAGAQP